MSKNIQTKESYSFNTNNNNQDFKESINRSLMKLNIISTDQ